MLKQENNTIVIFGASGDLTLRKLIPALYHLFANHQLADDFAILGVSRTDYNDQSYRQKLQHTLEKNEKIIPEILERFLQHIYYQAIDTKRVEDYGLIKTRLTDLSQKHQTNGNVLYYLSTPPSLYGIIPACLANYGLNSEEQGWKRLIVEKPFGYDLQSAIELDKQLHLSFQEHQIYRIDHYLGKETVQNLLVLRFSNGLFEPLWNRNYIEYVEITGAESIGVEERGGYYDGSGAMRDMFQNHLLQVLALVAMESPAVINADAMRNEVVKVLQSLHPLDQDLEKNLVLGQYTQSTLKGEVIAGYRQEKGVDPQSQTETFMALRLAIDNWRWAGVPFYIRTGKRLPTRVTEIVIHFKKTPHPVFSLNSSENKLIIRIQPDEGIMMNFSLKQPGAGFQTKEVSMDFHYNSLAEESEMLSAYERLLLDALKGDATLFTRSDAVQACWKFVQPILDYKANNPTIHGYACGTWGPEAADALMQRSNREWRFPCKNLIDTNFCEL